MFVARTRGELADRRGKDRLGEGGEVLIVDGILAVRKEVGGGLRFGRRVVLEVGDAGQHVERARRLVFERDVALRAVDALVVIEELVVLLPGSLMAEREVRR